MVTFNELRITEDRQCLIVDCEVENIDIYRDMYIKSIYLEYYKNASAASMPSDMAYKMFENSKNGEPDTKLKAVRVSLPDSSLYKTGFNISGYEDGLFYVVVVCDGELARNVANYPCGYDDVVTIGAVIDWKTFYQMGMQYVASIYGNCGNPNFCENPDGFEDFVLLWNALKLALSSCNWPFVAQLWDRFLNAPYSKTSVPSSVTGSRGCGCGR